MDDFIYYCEIIKAFFGAFLFSVIGAVVISHGELFGIVFFIIAALLAIVGVAMVITTIKIKKDGNDEKG